LLFAAVVVRAEPELLEVGGGIGGLFEERDPFGGEAVDLERAPAMGMGEQDAEDVVGGGNLGREALPRVVGGGKDEGQGQGTGGCTGEEGVEGVRVGDVFALVEGQGE